jgi:hypothetical protein
VVDGEDMRRGWLLSKILGKKHEEDEETVPALGGEDPERPAGRRRGSGWGNRGISVSADEGVFEDERQSFGDEAPDARMKDPDELARVLEDEDDASDDDHQHHNGEASVPNVGSGEEWRDGPK